MSNRYRPWKSKIPILYDFITNHSSKEYIQTCQWSSVVRIPQQLEGVPPQQRFHAISQDTKSIIGIYEAGINRLGESDILMNNRFDEDAISDHIRMRSRIRHTSTVVAFKEYSRFPGVLASVTSCNPEITIWKTGENRLKHEYKEDDPRL